MSRYKHKMISFSYANPVKISWIQQFRESYLLQIKSNHKIETHGESHGRKKPERPVADYKISRLLIHLEAHSSLSFTDSYPDPPLAQNCQRILVKIQKSCYNIWVCACGEIGRRTRLRIWRFIHGGSSPFTRTISVQSFSAIKQQRFFYYLLTRLIICIGNPLILCLRLFNIVLIV